MDKKPNRTSEQDLIAKIDLLAHSLTYAPHRLVLNDLPICLLNITETPLSKELINYYTNYLENLAHEHYQENPVGVKLLTLAALIRENYLAK